MAKFIHILRELYTEPWLIRPEMHEQLCRIVEAHVSGAAHEQGGIIEKMLGVEEEETPMLQKIDNVGIVTINGVIGKKVSALQKSSGVVDVDDVQSAIHEAVGDESIDGIVMNISSPGGTVSGVPELASFIKAAGSEKRIVAFSDTLMASAAYWIGAQSFAIIASETAAIGSIGVYLALLDSSKRFNDNGLKMEVFKGGKLKGMGIQGTSLTDEQRAFLQERVEFLHDKFKAAVRSGRGVSVSDEVMEGQDFFGEQAAANRLVDMVGTMQDAMELAVKGGQV